MSPARVVRGRKVEMAKINRPPLAAAREHATKALIAAHKAEHDELAQEYLDRAGWVREEVTTHRWTTTDKGEGS